MTPTTFCPYCGVLLQGAPSNIDHIFVKALGGKSTIRSCENCNSNAGSEIEGKFLKQGSVGHFIQQVRQQAGHPLRGQIKSSGVNIDHVLGERDVHFRNPVAKTQDGQKTTYNITAGVAQGKRIVRQIANSLDLSQSEANELWEQRTVQSLEGEEFDIEIQLDLALARRLAAKVTLGACAAAFGDVFIASGLAHDLREFMNGDGLLSSDWASSEALDLVDNLIMNALPAEAAAGVNAAKPLVGTSQVVLISTPKGVASFVNLAGLDLTPMTPLFLQAMPDGAYLPIVIRDGSGGVVVSKFEDDIANAMSLRNGDAYS